MKKLLVLMLVLAMGSMASAGLDFSKGNGAELGIMDPGGTGAVAAVIGLSEALGTEGLWVTEDLTPALRLADPVGLFDMSVIGRADLGSMNLWLIGWGAAGDRAGGKHATVTPPGVPGWGDEDLGLGTAVLLDADTYEQIAIAYVTPEPLTLGLLGVGALFLRRRK